MHRRKFLTILGVGTLSSAAGAGTFLSTRTPTAALAPWGQAGAYADPRLSALSYAVLAPNPHNMQPWLVDLEGDRAFSLYFNQDKQLPHTDPFDRQLTIGLGCFLELARMAAAAQGNRLDITLFPDGENETDLGAGRIARAVLSPDASQSADPLFAHVLDRRSTKEPYDTARPVPQSVLDTMVAVGGSGTKLGGSVDPVDTAYWRQLTEDALMIEFETDRTYKESVDVFRIGKQEVNATPDGIDLSGAMFDTLYATGLFNRDNALDRSSLGYQSGVDMVRGNCRTSMGHVWMTTPTNSRTDQIRAGRDWLRINLAATAAGVGFQPMSQALQEYPEMKGLFDEVHARLAPEGGVVQMLSRIGYGPTVAPAPRWPIDAKVRSA